MRVRAEMFGHFAKQFLLFFWKRVEDKMVHIMQNGNFNFTDFFRREFQSFINKKFLQNLLPAKN